MGKSLRDHYTREHPRWPNTQAQAIMEITEINDLLDKGGWTRTQRAWAYDRRRKLQRYINDAAYRTEVAARMRVGKTIV